MHDVNPFGIYNNPMRIVGESSINILCFNQVPLCVVYIELHFYYHETNNSNDL